MAGQFRLGEFGYSKGPSAIIGNKGAVTCCTMSMYMVKAASSYSANLPQVATFRKASPRMDDVRGRSGFRRGVVLGVSIIINIFAQQQDSFIIS